MLRNSIASVVLFFASAVATLALGAGMGPIQVGSVLGQPFAAEVELLGLSADDMLTAQTQIASREEFEKAGVPYTSLVYSMRVSIDERGKDRRFLKLSSGVPVNEPAITVIVEFSWRGGRLLQKFPVLLDPPKT